MGSINSVHSNDSTEALFKEAVIMLEDDVPPPPSTIPEAGKTPTTI